MSDDCSLNSCDLRDRAVGADFTLMGVEEIVGVVVGKGRLKDCVNESLVSCAELVRTCLNSDDVEVEFSGYNVDANVLNDPVVIVGCHNLEVWVGIAVSITTFGEGSILTTIVAVLDGVQRFLSPAIGQIIEILTHCESAVEVENIVFVLACLR